MLRYRTLYLPWFMFYIEWKKRSVRTFDKYISCSNIPWQPIFHFTRSAILIRNGLSNHRLGKVVYGFIRGLKGQRNFCCSMDFLLHNFILNTVHKFDLFRISLRTETFFLYILTHFQCNIIWIKANNMCCQQFKTSLWYWNNFWQTGRQTR